MGRAVSPRLVLAELALGAVRAKHMQLVVDARVGTPLVSRVLSVVRLAATLGANERCYGRRVALHRVSRASSCGYPNDDN